jgi:hypothetical protein
VDAARTKGPRGEQAYQDVVSYVTGINTYISQAKGLLTQPGEYRRPARHRLGRLPTHVRTLRPDAGCRARQLVRLLAV